MVYLALPRPRTRGLLEAGADRTPARRGEPGGKSSAKRTFLDFEQPIAELESKIEELRYVQTESAVDISEEIDQLSKKSQQLTKDIYSDLTPWQITKIARHPERPYTLDYIGDIFTDFIELHGDRHFADDLSIVGGLARFNGTACMVVGQQKGRDTRERGLRNFGMSKPEGYRKALRLMKTAEKFGLPVFTFVDTPGAYPGIDAEERGQSEAIGRNIFEMAQLEVPIITTIIGEGGSGGALAISVADHLQRIDEDQNSIRVSYEEALHLLLQPLADGSALRTEMDAVRRVLCDLEEAVLDAKDGVLQAEIEGGALLHAHSPDRFSLGHRHRQPQGQPGLAHLG